MTHDPTHSLPSPLSAQVELEFLEVLLQGSIAYSWNLPDMGAEGHENSTEKYFDDLEQDLFAVGWTREEISQEGERLAVNLEKAWADLPPAFASMPLPQGELFQQYAAHIPQPILDRILQRAKQVVELPISLSDQLVQCVQDCLPQWAEDDLQVFARPFAYAMRDAHPRSGQASSTEVLEVALRSVRCAAWTELSGVEQARLSLAIARYAIAQNPTSPPNLP